MNFFDLRNGFLRLFAEAKGKYNVTGYDIVEVTTIK